MKSPRNNRLCSFCTIKVDSGYVATNDAHTPPETSTPFVGRPPVFFATSVATEQRRTEPEVDEVSPPPPSAPRSNWQSNRPHHVHVRHHFRRLPTKPPPPGPTPYYLPTHSQTAPTRSDSTLGGAFLSDATGYPQIQLLERDLLDLESVEETGALASAGGDPAPPNEDGTRRLRKQLSLLGRHTTNKSRALMRELADLFDRVAGMERKNRGLVNALSELSVEHPFLSPNGERLFGEGRGRFMFSGGCGVLA